MAPLAMVTLSVIEPTSPPPPLVAVVEAMACAVSSYCARVGVLDDEHAAMDRARGSNVMRFMGVPRLRDQQAADQRADRRIASIVAKVQRGGRTPTSTYPHRRASGNTTDAGSANAAPGAP